MKKNWLFLLTLVIALTILGCADTGVRFEPVQKPIPVDMKDVSFHLTDELKEQMESNGLSGLALVTVVCRS